MEPANIEDVLVSAPSNLPRGRSWRRLPKDIGQGFYFSSLVFEDKWTLSKQQVESTRLFGEDYAELANIARLYQLSMPRPVSFKIVLYIFRLTLRIEQIPRGLLHQLDHCV